MAAECLLRLREQFADGDASASPSLEDPRPGDTQCEVLLIRRIDQVIEDGVVEDLPPLGQLGRLALDTRVGGVDPLRSHRGRRRSVVGPDFKAVVRPLRQAASGGQQSGHDQRQPPAVAAHRCAHGANARRLNRRPSSAGGNW